MIATDSAQHARREGRDQPVLLVVPSFQGLKCPALSISQLKANLLEAGIPAEGLYLNLRFAERIGPQVHEWLSGTGPTMIGEFIFSHALHPRAEEEAVERYIREILAGTPTEDALNKFVAKGSTAACLHHLIAEARDFVRTDAMDEILARDPWMVGMSSTFQANCCSLALIRELKRHRPEVVTVIGGANCEREMGEEIRRRYPEVDFVGRGECDRTFVDLVSKLRAGEPARNVLGFLGKDDEAFSPPSAPLHGGELDAQPHPDFDDYFDGLSRFSQREKIEPGLAMETSRGCWWGEKHHCTFCAFNRDGMVFRSKSPERVLEELAAQVERHGLDRLEMTDNILDMAYFKTLLKDLAENPIADFFWETKANLTLEQVDLMARAGVRWIQPGIESLSDKTLELMRKGSTGLQNIQLLKWSTERGIKITWNWLFGFPGEDEDELDGLEEMVRSIHHLPPPGVAPVIYLERFSPYHMTPEEWGLEPVRPAKAYRHVYPFPEEALTNMAFFFESDYFTAKENGAAHKRLNEIVDEWGRAHADAHLLAIPKKKTLLLFDTRPHAKRLVHRLSGLDRNLYEYCGTAHGPNDILRKFKNEASEERILARLQSMVDDRIMLKGNNRFLSVATDPSLGYRDFLRVFPGGQLNLAPSPNGAPPPTNDAGRKLLDVLMLRKHPRAAAGAAWRKLRTSAARRTVSYLSRPRT